MRSSDFDRRLRQLQADGWTLHEDGTRIAREYRLRDFRTAFSLMQQIATRAEEIQHHPDWSNSYNRLHISLTTHDAGGLTDKDLILAEYIQSLCDRA